MMMLQTFAAFSWLSSANATVLSEPQLQALFYTIKVSVRAERLSNGESDEALRARVTRVVALANRNLLTLGVSLELNSISIEEVELPENTTYGILKSALSQAIERQQSEQVSLVLLRRQRSDLNLGLTVTGSICKNKATAVVAVSSGSSDDLLNTAGDTVSHEMAHTLGLSHDESICEGDNDSLSLVQSFNIMSAHAHSHNCGFSAAQRRYAAEQLAGERGSCLTREEIGVPELSVNIPESIVVREDQPYFGSVIATGALAVSVKGLPEGGTFDAASGALNLPAPGYNAFSGNKANYQLIVEIMPMFGAVERKVIPVYVTNVDRAPYFAEGSAITVYEKSGKITTQLSAFDLDGDSVGITCDKVKDLKFSVSGSTLKLSGKYKKATAFSCSAHSNGLVSSIRVSLAKAIKVKAKRK